MADNTELNPGAGGDIAATDDIDGVKWQRVKLTLGADGVNDGDVSESNPIPVAGSLSVSNFPAQTGLTNAELRAEAVPVQDPDAGSLLRQILRVLLAPLGYDKSSQRTRVTALIESGTVSTVTTVTTVANQTNIGGVQAQILVNGQNVSAWQACVRSRIT